VAVGLSAVWVGKDGVWANHNELSVDPDNSWVRVVGSRLALVNDLALKPHCQGPSSAYATVTLPDSASRWGRGRGGCGCGLQYSNAKKGFIVQILLGLLCHHPPARSQPCIVATNEMDSQSGDSEATLQPRSECKRSHAATKRPG
jgi:hypothetical protein